MITHGNFTWFVNKTTWGSDTLHPFSWSKSVSPKTWNISLTAKGIGPVNPEFFAMTSLISIASASIPHLLWLRWLCFSTNRQTPSHLCPYLETLIWHLLEYSALCRLRNFMSACKNNENWWRVSLLCFESISRLFLLSYVVLVCSFVIHFRTFAIQT